MKYLIRSYLINLFALWFTRQILPFFTIPDDLRIYALAAFILSILMLLVQPILKILFIPITIITFGILSWLINVIVLYIFLLFVPEIQVHAWIFPGFDVAGFIIPQFHMVYIVSLIVSSIVLTSITNILYSITK